MADLPDDPATGKPHVVVVNRWRERYALYGDYLDHDTHRVTYVTTEVGLGSVPAGAADVVVVAATDDLDGARTALALLVSRHGPARGLVALKEDDLLVAAQLRHEFGIPGPRRADVLPFRDKYLMAAKVAVNRLPVPAFAAADDAAAVLDLGKRFGWPLVLKPRLGSSAEGVQILAGPQDVVDLPLTEDTHIVQRFDPHPIHHVDGVFDGRELVTWRVSRYVNTCTGFRTGSVLGSVEVDDPAVVRAVEEATTGYLAALTRGPVPFHLELFVETAADGTVSCRFLEVGARVGGAEVALVWREVHGYDLMRAAFDLQLGRTPPPPDPDRAFPRPRTAPPVGPEVTDGRDVAGWLLAPAPAARPCVITDVTPMVGREPGPYAEALLAPGEVLPAADAYYEHVGGRFRFRGRSGAEVERALRATAQGFHVTAEPLGEPVGAAVPVPAGADR